VEHKTGDRRPAPQHFSQAQRYFQGVFFLPFHCPHLLWAGMCKEGVPCNHQWASDQCRRTTNRLALWPVGLHE